MAAIGGFRSDLSVTRKTDGNFGNVSAGVLFSKVAYYSLSRKTVNTRENFWNVYCFAANQKRDETAKDNCQTAGWISHDLTRNNELAFSSTINLQFCRFQILKSFFFVFQFIYMQRIDMNDMFSKILRESVVESSR